MSSRLRTSTDPGADPYQKHRQPARPVVIEGSDEFEIERIITKRRIRRGRRFSLQCLVRWLGYSPEHDWWMPAWKLSHAQDLVDEYERIFGPAVAIETASYASDNEAKDQMLVMCFIFSQL